MEKTLVSIKEQNKDLKVIAVEPARSPFLSKGYTGAHKIQGIGSEFISNNLDIKLIDEIIDVDDTDAFKTAQDLAKLDGVVDYSHENLFYGWLIKYMEGWSHLMHNQSSNSAESTCKTWSMVSSSRSVRAASSSGESASTARAVSRPIAFSASIIH